jgi:hypothetical protein
MVVLNTDVKAPVRKALSRFFTRTWKRRQENGVDVTLSKRILRNVALKWPVTKAEIIEDFTSIDESKNYVDNVVTDLIRKNQLKEVIVDGQTMIVLNVGVEVFTRRDALLLSLAGIPLVMIIISISVGNPLALVFSVVMTLLASGYLAGR